MSFYLRELTQIEQTSSEIDWEECDCLLCGSDKWAPHVEAPDRAARDSGKWFLVVRCPDCGLCFTNPRPRAGSMKAFYPAEYAPHQPAGNSAKAPRWWQRLPFVRARGDLARKLLPLHGRGRLLDFGCGSGSFVLRMRQQGWQVTGLDLSETVVDHLRSQFGLHVFSGSLPHPALDDGSFDVITMWQALEHVHQPLDTLRAAHRLLAPGGKLMVTVPNIESLAFRWFGSCWNGLDLPRHLVHFSPQTLRHMLHRAGFETGRVHMVRRSGWLRDSARLARARSSSRWFRWLGGKGMSNALSWFAYWTRQADCLMVTGSPRAA